MCRAEAVSVTHRRSADDDNGGGGPVDQPSAAGATRRRSVEPAAAEVVGDDDVGDGVEDELNVVGVGGARLMTVDLLRCAFVLRLELCLDIGGSLLVRLLACEGVQTTTT